MTQGNGWHSRQDWNLRFKEQEFFTLSLFFNPGKLGLEGIWFSSMLVY
jgi:hypothetical protein